MLSPVQKYRADALKISVCQSVEDLAELAASEAQKFLRAAIAIKGRAAAIIATGNSQLLFLEKLTALGGIDWSLVTLFHMDEYLGISADHPASFRRYVKERVADKIHPRAMHYIKGDALEPILECLRYEALVTTAFGLLVAIPAVMTFNYFTGKVEAFDVEMDNSSSELVDYFIKQSHR